MTASATFPTMRVENQWTAAIGNYFLDEIICIGITRAIHHFNRTIAEGITMYEIYRDGKLRYRYDRQRDLITPVERFTV